MSGIKKVPILLLSQNNNHNKINHILFRFLVLRYFILDTYPMNTKTVIYSNPYISSIGMNYRIISFHCMLTKIVGRESIFGGRVSYPLPKSYKPSLDYTQRFTVNDKHLGPEVREIICYTSHK